MKYSPRGNENSVSLLHSSVHFLLSTNKPFFFVSSFFRPILSSQVRAWQAHGKDRGSARSRCRSHYHTQYIPIQANSTVSIYVFTFKKKHMRNRNKNQNRIADFGEKKCLFSILKRHEKYAGDLRTREKERERIPFT